MLFDPARGSAVAGCGSMGNTDGIGMTPHDPLGRFAAPLVRSRTGVVVLAAATIAVIGYLDRLTGTQLSVTALYLVPVAVAAWYVGRTGGRIASVAAGLAQVTADLLDVHGAVELPVVVWNAATIIVLSMVVGEVLTRLHAALDAEHDLARTDALTSLPNTRSFHELAVLELERSRRYRRTFTVACLDLDNFKTVNDTLGHAVGDRLIRDVGQALRANLRRVDIVARLGGDEFTLLLPETDAAQARIAMSHVQDALRSLTESYAAEVKASIGVVTFKTSPQTVGDMVRLADTAMYRAKAAGRDRIEAITMPEDATRLEEFELTALHEMAGRVVPLAGAEPAPDPESAPA
jgi:diguanylate cyclase (GGDEF)-like protein